jgi:hypothetical protein
MALGTFIGSFVNDAFLGGGAAATLALQPLSDGASVSWRCNF